MREQQTNGLTQYMAFLGASSVMAAAVLIGWASGVEDFAVFDVRDVEPSRNDVPGIEPWKVVTLDPDYGGQWVVAGDLDGDGAVEIVSAENVNQGDVHFTSAVVAQRLDGTVLWRWGDPQPGRKVWHHDVACQIYDFNGDGAPEVVLSTKGFLVELAGATGKELRRIAIPVEATDCLVFCNLSGGRDRGEVLVKDRYHQIWAYNRKGERLWTIKDPGGFMTAHQPRPMDIDGDEREEILAGFALLNPDGSVRWTYQPQTESIRSGHLDCGRILRQGKKPEDTRIVMTCCGGNAIVLLDGNGKQIWEQTGQHFESVDIGRILPEPAGPQIVVDIDHKSYGDGPLWILDQAGKRLGRIITVYSRHHGLVDFNSDGLDEIIVGQNSSIYDSHGRRIGIFLTPGLTLKHTQDDFEVSILTGEMTGDGVLDVLIVTPQTVFVYRNPSARGIRPPFPLGTELNLTLY